MEAILLIALVVGGAALLSWPLGRYLRWAMDPESPSAVAQRCTGLFQAIGGPLTGASHDWKQYCKALLGFNVVMFAIGFAILACQQWLPLNPDGRAELEASLIFNT